MTRTILSLLVVVATPLTVLQHAHAYPDRPIRLIVPSAAGGPPDIMARVVSDRLAAILGQPVIVENRAAGAGGTIGTRSVASAEPDGYTLLLGSTSTLLI